MAECKECGGKGWNHNGPPIIIKGYGCVATSTIVDCPFCKPKTPKEDKE